MSEVSKRGRIVRDCLIITVMVGTSYQAGRWSYGERLASSQSVDFDFRRPFRIPSGYESVGFKPIPETAHLRVGDRVDIFLQEGDEISPIIVDALVTDQSKRNFGLLVPLGGRTILSQAREYQLKLIYRPSIAPRGAIELEAYKE